MLFGASLDDSHVLEGNNLAYELALDNTMGTFIL